VLQVVFPEYEHFFKSFTHRTPMAMLAAFPSPEDLLRAPKRKVLKVLKDASRNHLGLDAYTMLTEAARNTLALPTAKGALREEIGLLVERYALYERQIEQIEQRMVAELDGLPETPALLSVPLVAPLTAAVFLGSIGDPQSYNSSREILRLAGLTLTERSSGTHKGEPHISKRGRPGLRAMAYMLAVRGIARKGPYRAEYDRLMARNGGQAHKALVAIARRALRQLYSVARHRRLWTPEPPSRGEGLASGTEGVRLDTAVSNG